MALTAESVYLFRHAVMRDAAYQLVLPSQRGRLHRVALEALEDVTPDHARDAIALELAQHAEVASTSRATNSAQHAAKALHYLLRAGEHLERNFDLVGATDAFARASVLARGRPEAEQARLRQATLLRKTGHLARAQDVLAQLDPTSHRVESELGHVKLAQGQVDAATASFEQAVKELRKGSDSVALGQALGNLASALHAKGDLEGAETLFAEAELLLRKNTNVVLRANRAKLMMDTQGHASALRANRELVDETRNAGDLYSLASLLINLGILQHRVPDADGARKSYLEAGDLGRKLGSRLVEQVSLANLAALMIDLEHHDQAHVALDRSLELAREIGDRRGVVTALVNLVHLSARMQLDPRRVHKLLRQAQSEVRQVGDPVLAASVLAARGMLAADRGREATARRILARVESLVKRAGLHQDSQAASHTAILRSRLAPQ